GSGAGVDEGVAGAACPADGSVDGDGAGAGVSDRDEGAGGGGAADDCGVGDAGSVAGKGAAEGSPAVAEAGCAVGCGSAAAAVSLSDAGAGVQPITAAIHITPNKRLGTLRFTIEGARRKVAVSWRKMRGGDADAAGAWHRRLERASQGGVS